MLELYYFFLHFMLADCLRGLDRVRAAFIYSLLEDLLKLKYTEGTFVEVSKAENDEAQMLPWNYVSQTYSHF